MRLNTKTAPRYASCTAHCCDTGCQRDSKGVSKSHGERRKAEGDPDDTLGSSTSDGESGESRLGGAGASDVDAAAQTLEKQPQSGWTINVLAAEVSPDPRRKLEEAISEIASQIREKPTLPPDSQNPSEPFLDGDKAVPLPQKHCAFSGCVWFGTTDDELQTHLLRNHSRALQSAVGMLPCLFTDRERAFGVYGQAIAEKIREGPPLACASIDRRALHAYASSLSDENVASLVCLSCAQVWPRVASDRSLNIDWVPLCPTSSQDTGSGIDRFCGMSRARAAEIFGSKRI